MFVFLKVLQLLQDGTVLELLCQTNLFYALIMFYFEFWIV